jgi:hypothetical protein
MQRSSIVNLLDLPNELLLLIAELLYGLSDQPRHSGASSLQNFSSVNRHLRATTFPLLVRRPRFDSWEQLCRVILPGFRDGGRWQHLAPYVRFVAQ